ncbi:hypothetical protein [Nocardia wallacei]|uniref:hypothetical protein n=1 Tax=Nocardia wallacei TaxID=480035 RepID=UPI002453A32E|nr:hypothetical protein [Nocardia wallacei]
MDTLLRDLDPEQRARFEIALTEMGRGSVADGCPTIPQGVLADRSGIGVDGVDAERLAYIKAHPRRIDRKGVDELSVVLAAWRKLDDSVGSEAVLPAVNETVHEFGPMIGLSEAAGRYKQASPAVLAVAAQQEARGHALLGKAEEAERQLDRADEYAVRAAEEPDRIPPWLYFHSTDLLVLQRGLAYKYLAESGRPKYRRKAIAVLTAGLSGLDQETRESDWMRWYVDQLAELVHGTDWRQP